MADGTLVRVTFKGGRPLGKKGTCPSCGKKSARHRLVERASGTAYRCESCGEYHSAGELPKARNY
jgi:uncharacterized Zn finger protein